MTTLRKVLPFLLLALVALWTFISHPSPINPQVAYAQTPDCSFTFHFTGVATQTAVSNLSGGTPCVNWRLTLSTTGSLSATVTFYTSPDNSTWTAVPNTVCSSTVQPPCVLQGANPMVGAQGMLYSAAYGSYVKVIVSSPSGSGTGTVRGYGAKGASAAALPGSGGGGGITGLTTGTIPEATSAASLGDSPITDDGTTVTVGGGRNLAVGNTVVSPTVGITTPAISLGATPPAVIAGSGAVWAGNEGTAPSSCAAASVDCVYMDSTRHALLASYNNGSYFPFTRTIASGQTAMPTGALAANTCSASATTGTATGALTTDAVKLTYASDPTGVTGYGAGTNGGITIRAWLTVDAINFKLCNETGTSVTPGALNVNWGVTR